MQVNRYNTGKDFAVLMPDKQHFTKAMVLLWDIQRVHAEGHHKIVCPQRAGQSFAPLPSSWSWAPHSCSVLTTFAAAFHGLADTHVSHCCCLLDKKQPDCDWITVWFLKSHGAQQLHTPLWMLNRKAMLLRQDSSPLRPLGLSVNRADYISSLCAQSNAQGDSSY